MNQPNEPFSQLWDLIARKLGLESTQQERGPQTVRPIRPGRRKSRLRLWIVLGVAALLVFFILPWLVYLFTEWLWFDEVGYKSVFSKILLTKLVLAVGTGIFLFAFIYANALIARRMAPRFRQGKDQDIIERVAVPDAVVRWLIPLFLLLPALIAMAAGAAAWDEVLRFFSRTEFGMVEPVFNRDAGFFIFTLPILQILRTLLWWTLLLSVIVTTATHFFDYAINWSEGRLTLAPHVKAHLSILLGLLMLVWGSGYLLRGYELLFSSRGVVFGASYTDVHAQLPVFRFLAATAVIAGILFFINIYFRGWKLPVAAIVLIIATSILAGRVYPFVVQQYQVSPNELEKEEPYIKHNIDFTRAGFDLGDVDERPFSATDNLTAEGVQRNSSTISNVRLWDPATLAQTYSQIQTIRPYYQFLDVDVDRYTFGGRLQQVMSSPRELNIDALDPRAKTWQNEHLVYTHGYGIVMSPVAQVSTEGLPQLVVKDIPPQTSIPELGTTQPAIYFGERATEYVVVGGEMQEFDYPRGDDNVYSTYEGNAGISMSSSLARAAFSSRYGSLKLLVSDAIGEKSRIIIHREIKDRVSNIAPFLTYDDDPYVTLVDGRIFWILDAYTTTEYMPYSQPDDQGVNYIRNSVKVVVDAYNGDVTFYLVDDSDPLARVYGDIFPELFTPGDEMPPGIREHLRYPEDLFKTQAEMYATYHMTDPKVFYNKEDQWNMPQIQSGNRTVDMDPYYVIMSLPGDAKEEFMLMLPFTPGTRENIIAWMAARSDPQSYGERVVFKFPKEKLVFGPSQIQARFNQDANISQQITLWSQSGSQVIFGNLLVIPVDESIMYVQPLYLRADRSQIPEMRRVLVSYGGRVLMAEDLAEALRSLFGAQISGLPERPGTAEPAPAGPGAPVTPEQPPTTGTPTTPAGPATTPAPDAEGATLDQLAESALDHYNKATDAQRRGDWAVYGAELKALEETLRRMQEESPE